MVLENFGNSFTKVFYSRRELENELETLYCIIYAFQKNQSNFLHNLGLQFELTRSTYGYVRYCYYMFF